MVMINGKQRRLETHAMIHPFLPPSHQDILVITRPRDDDAAIHSRECLGVLDARGGPGAFEDVGEEGGTEMGKGFVEDLRRCVGKGKGQGEGRRLTATTPSVIIHNCEKRMTTSSRWASWILSIYQHRTKEGEGEKTHPSSNQLSAYTQVSPRFKEFCCWFEETPVGAGGVTSVVVVPGAATLTLATSTRGATVVVTTVVSVAVTEAVAVIVERKTTVVLAPADVTVTVARVALCSSRLEEGKMRVFCRVAERESEGARVASSSTDPAPSSSSSPLDWLSSSSGSESIDSPSSSSDSASGVGGGRSCRRLI